MFLRVTRATRLLTSVSAATLLCLGMASDENGQARQAPSASETPGTYWLGESFRALPLTATPGSDYIYGDCEAEPDSGCAPPVEVQNSSTCGRNPVGLDVAPTRIHALPGGAIAASYGRASVDVGIGRQTVTLFAAGALNAARELRRRGAASPPARYPPPVYPKAALRELKRALVARRRFHTIRAISRVTGVPPKATRARLRLARLLAGDLAGVKAPTRSPAAVERDRQIAFEAGESGEARTARRLGISRAQLRKVIRRVRGLVGYC